MTINGWFQIAVFLAAVLAVTVPLGRFMTRVFNRERTWLDPALRPIERLIYRATLVDERTCVGARPNLADMAPLMLVQVVPPSLLSCH